MKTEDIKIGYNYTNSNGDIYTVLELTEKTKSGHKKFLIEFIETKFRIIVWQTSIISGQIRDYLKPSVFGVGCMGYALGINNMKTYNLWHNMLSRCYNIKSSDYPAYGMIGVKVCNRWLRYDMFLEDLTKIDGYNYDMFINGEIVLDKDIKQKGKMPWEKVYSLETCCFISNAYNISLRNTDRYKRSFVTINTISGEKETHTEGVVEYCKNNQCSANIVKDCLDGKRKIYKDVKYLNIIMKRV